MTNFESDLDSYSELALQRLMVSDRPRTEAFAEALAEVVQPGDRVIDVGTGTGLLALLAARAGASKVTALERAAIAEVAKRLVRANGLSDVVEVSRGSASDHRSSEKVDLIVSEWLGHFALTEGMLRHVLACRDANLREGGVMMPSQFELCLAPVESEMLYEDDGPGFWRRSIHGVDLHSLEGEEVRQAIAIKTLVQPEELLGDAGVMLSLELASAKLEDAWRSGRLDFVASRAGTLHGFVGWFRAQLSPSVCLDTAPSEPVTHWQQTYFAFEPVAVAEGETISVDFVLTEHPVYSAGLEVELSACDQRHYFMVT